MNSKKKTIIIVAAVVVALGAWLLSYALTKDASKVSGTTAAVTTTTTAAVTETGTAATVDEASTDDTSETSETSTTKKGDTTSSTASTSGSSTSASMSVSNGATTRTTARTTASATARGTTARTTTKAGTTAKSTTSATTTTSAPPISIVLKKNGKASCNSEKVTIYNASLTNPQGTVYIEKSGDYVITSSTSVWHGQIIIKLANTEKANVRFENVNIETSKANAVRILDTSISAERSFIEADASTGDSDIDTDSALRDEMKDVSKNEKAPNVDLSFPTGTSSSFKTNANALSGVFYNESKLTIRGNGAVSITATANRNNAICSTKSVTFKNVSATLATAANNSDSALGSARGIFSFSTVKVESGKLTIKTNGDAIRCDDFTIEGGTAVLTSSAADGIDADDSIIINGGSLTSIALKKSCFKVRRINNQERIKEGDTTVKASDGVTDTSKHTFRINGGAVRGESKNITTLKSSKQASILCRSVKKDKSTGKAAADTSKTPVIFTIGGLKVSSKNYCIKLIYSSSKISTKSSYTVSAKSATKKSFDSQKVKFSGNNGTAQIYTAQVKSS